MATAPRPGAGARAQAQQTARTQRWKLTLDEDVLEMAMAMPLAEKMAVRQATGFPLEAFLPTDESQKANFGEDSFSVLWWLARRANGEPRLPYADVLGNWVTPKVIGLEVVTDDDEPTDDPGKSEAD